jgi:hypothetical protein
MTVFASARRARRSGPRGELSELVVGEGPAERRLPFGSGLRLRPKNRSAA